MVETALYHFGTDHAEGNVHINKARKNLIDAGINVFPESVLWGYEKKYYELLASGPQSC